MYSRNQTTIASRCKHRQPVFLHPTIDGNWNARRTRWLRESSRCIRAEILRKERSGSRQRGSRAQSRVAHASCASTCRFRLQPLHYKFSNSFDGSSCVISPARGWDNGLKRGAWVGSLSNALRLAVAILSLWSLSGCGGGTKAGPPIFPGRVNLTPGINTSLVLGGVLVSPHRRKPPPAPTSPRRFTFHLQRHLDFDSRPQRRRLRRTLGRQLHHLHPRQHGPVQVTASALGASSVPTYVFVHPPIDNITVTGVLLDGVPVQEPCLSQSQSMTVEAHAFSQGTDITASVGLLPGPRITPAWSA